MTLRAALLGLLSEKPATGYELIKEFDVAESVIWPAPKGEIYRELAKLEKEGFAVPEAEAGGRGQRRWRITPKGRAELKRWLKAEADYSLRYEPMLRTAFLPALERSEIGARIAVDRAFFQSQLAALKPLLRTSRTGRRAYALPMAVAFYEAMLSWCEAAEKLAPGKS